MSFLKFNSKPIFKNVRVKVKLKEKLQELGDGWDKVSPGFLKEMYEDCGKTFTGDIFISDDGELWFEPTSEAGWEGITWCYNLDWLEFKNKKLRKTIRILYE